MSGFVGDLSAEQEAALEQDIIRRIVAEFKAAIADLKTPFKTDHYLLTWLRARRFNVAKAETMIRNSMKFREEIGADTILDDYDPPEVLKECSASGIFGEDRDGHPVLYYAMGNLDFRGLYRSATKEDMSKHRIQIAERLVKLCEKMSEEKGRIIDNWTIVMDLENLSYQRHYYWPMIHIVNESLSTFDANYPERCRRAIVVKAPRIFPVAFNIVKYFIDENTKRKIIIAGSNWREELQKYISPDNLPVYYGGTRREPDDVCSDYIQIGKDVPEKYFFTNLLETSKEEMEMVTVNRGSSHQLQYEVEIPGTIIRWEIVTKDYDVGFGLYYKPMGQTERLHAGDMEAKIPTDRKESHVVPETGMYTCTDPGIYVVRLDNTYSWTRPKEVFYSIKILPPDTEICSSMPPSETVV